MKLETNRFSLFFSEKIEKRRNWIYLVFLGYYITLIYASRRITNLITYI